MTKEEELALATEMYTQYVAAEKVVLTGQSYAIKDRTLTRANLAEIRAGREEWHAKMLQAQAAVSTGSGGGIRVKRTIYRDGF